ncbi:MAG: amidohydrolase family protein [Thermoplasmatota archaeon]
MIEESIPLMKDKHNHISIYSALYDCLDIQHITSKEKALEMIENQNDDISIILGWNSGFFDFKKDEIDRLHPLIICDLSLHDILMNRPAEEYLMDKFPRLVENLNEQEWIEKNFSYIMKVMVSLKSVTVEKVNSFYDRLRKKGVLYIADMLLPDEGTLNVLKRSRLKDHFEAWADLETFERLTDTSKKYVKGIKFFVDGAIGTKTAAIKENFMNGKEGLLLYGGNELKEQLSIRLDKGKPMSIHTIGDIATEEVIDKLIEFEKEGIQLPYIRMEHCQFIDEEYAEKAKVLGINLCMQPTFSFDSVYYKDRLSKKYLKKNNPFRMLIDDIGFEPGNDLFFGSDGMPHGIYPALKSCLFPPLESQRLDIYEFIKAYCVKGKTHGYIDVEIHEEEQKIDANVVLKK